MTNITFKSWIHPATGEVRVYLSNIYQQAGSKVWVSKQAADSFGSDWNVTCRADWAMDTRAVRDEATNQIEAMLKGSKTRFADILALVA